MKKKRKLFVALVTVCALVMGSFAVPSAAAENVEPATTEEAAEQVTESTDVTVLREDESLRGEYEKHFLMSDGTYQVQVYSQPVHELVDGEWVEIQNTNQNARDSVGTDTTKSNIIDNYVLQGYGVQNKSLDRLYIGNRSAGLTRAYIQFAAMPTIPEGSTITGATMTLHFTSGTSTAANASAYQVTGGEWTSGTIQWSNKPAADVLLHGDIGHNNVTGYTINCLTAVQHWYDGDPTGQNENYGIMLRYYDEATADYNAVYSADYTDESLRPSMVIYYNSPTDEVSVLEGYTRGLSVSGETETVTWSSSNPTAATVDSNGVITGIRAGVTTVTASVGETVYKTYTVYVKIANGVYYIKNSDSLCLGTTGRVDEYTSASIYTKAASDALQLNVMWKITYLSCGYYSIRPMYRLSMGLHATSNNADITSISTTDLLSEIPLVNCWGIEYSSDGYVLTHVGTGSMALRASAPYPSAGVTTEIYSSDKSGFGWELERINNISDQIVFISTSTGAVLSDVVRYISTKSTMTMNDHGFTVSFVSENSNDQSFTWSTADTSIISLNSSTGAVIGLQAGYRARIFVQVANQYNSWQHAASYQVIAPLTMLYSITNSGHDHLSSLVNVMEKFNADDQTDTTLRYGSIAADDCKTDLKACTVFTSRSHGTTVLDANDNLVATGILLEDVIGNEVGTNFFSNSYVGMGEDSSAIESSDAFDDLGLALFIACETARDGAGGNNLPSVIVDHGALVAIGFKTNISCDAANNWTKAFYDSFLAGKTVRQAVEDATEVCAGGNGLSSWVIVGDGTLTINDLRP